METERDRFQVLDVRVSANPDKPEEDDLRVDYLADGKPSTVKFVRTGRGLSILDHFRRRGVEFALEDLRSKRILDVGCGKGQLVLELVRRGIEVVGLDVHLADWQKDPDHVRKRLARPDAPGLGAMAPGQALYVERSMTRTGFPEAEFDLILSFAVFHFAYAPEFIRASVLELLRVCRPGGTIALGPFEGAFLPVLDRIERESVDVDIVRRPWETHDNLYCVTLDRR